MTSMNFYSFTEKMKTFSRNSLAPKYIIKSILANSLIFAMAYLYSKCKDFSKE